MQLGAKGEALIKSFEKLRLAAYKPTPQDKWTIGWGHTGTDIVEGLTCTTEEADFWFFGDITWARVAVFATVTVDLTPNQFDALVSLIFNIGAVNWKLSTLLKVLNKGDLHGSVALEWMRWNHQDGKVLDGLTNRRKAEMALFQEA
jgi:lysozyme